MNSAVIFAIYIPNEVQLWMVDWYMDIINDHFSDCDVYVGINPSPVVDAVVDKLTPISNRIGVVSDLLVESSDASGYQHALKLKKEAGIQYDYYYFMHNKGSTSGVIDIAGVLATEYFARRDDFIPFQDHIGGYSYWLGFTQKLDNSSRYASFPYTATYLIPTYNYYTIRGSLVDKFLDSCDQSFFNQKYPDRYFYEQDFPDIVSRYGYQWAFSQMAFTFTNGFLTDQQYHQEITRWKAENNIS